ncbi:MAG: hypothetical protein R3C56_00370 [Pirellulaceae bacterium]
MSNIECASRRGGCPAEAKSQLARAVTMVDVLRRLGNRREHACVAGETSEQKRLRIKRMLASAAVVRSSPRWRASSQLLTWLLCGERFVVGSLMIAGCALWMRQNDLFNPQVLAASSNEMATDLASPQPAT